MCNFDRRIKSVLKSVGLSFEGRFHDIRKVACRDTVFDAILNATSNNMSEIMAPARASMNHSAYIFFYIYFY